MTIVDEVIQAYGGISAVKKRFKYTDNAAVYNWKSRGIPKRLLIQIHQDTGISLKKLNPV